MPLYHFKLIHDGAEAADPDGVRLPNNRSARDHALRVARELLKHEEVRKRHWLLEVRSKKGNTLFAVPFAEVDPTLAHLPPDMRQLIERTSENLRKLSDVVGKSRRMVQRVRGTLARAQKRPYLVAENGKQI